MITTVTMNASIDKAYQIKGFLNPGTVMRVADYKNSAGGKGLNAARVVHLCGVPVKATGIVGGCNGDYVQNLLTQDGIKHEFFRISGETRSCINVLTEEGSSTEFLEPGCKVTESEQEAFLDFFRDTLQDSSIIILSGSVPRGFSSDIYKKLIRIAREYEKTVLLDTRGSYLKEGITEKPDLVKPNKEELEELMGCRLDSMQALIESGCTLHKRNIRYVVVSLGADGALLICDDGCFHGKSERIHAVNTVGCGDSMVAAFAAALHRKEELKDCLAYSVAVSAANALSKKTGFFERGDLERVLGGVTIKRL